MCRCATTFSLLAFCSGLADAHRHVIPRKLDGDAPDNRYILLHSQNFHSEFPSHGDYYSDYHNKFDQWDKKHPSSYYEKPPKETGYNAKADVSAELKTANPLWADSFGSTGKDIGQAIATDNFGNSIVTGSFATALTVGKETLLPVAGGSIFVIKLNKDGTPKNAKSFGSSGGATSNDIAVDEKTGESIIVGTFSGTFTVAGTSYTSNTNTGDWFILKLNPYLDPIWFKAYGSTGNDAANSVSTDCYGNIYVTGDYAQQLPIEGVLLRKPDIQSAFVVRFNPYGGLLYAIALGNPNEYSSGQRIAADDQGNAIVGGQFQKTLTIAGFLLVGPAANDVFVVKINQTGRQVWVNGIVGNGFKGVGGVAIGPTGKVVVTGAYTDPLAIGGVTGTKLAHIDNDNDNFDIFVAKFSSSGLLIFARGFGGPADDAGSDVTVDKDESIYISGFSSGAVTIGRTTTTNANPGKFDILVFKLTHEGLPIWAKSFGGNKDDSAFGLDIDKECGVVITGPFESTFEVGDTLLNPKGLSDVFVIKLLEAQL